MAAMSSTSNPSSIVRDGCAAGCLLGGGDRHVASVRPQVDEAGGVGSPGVLDHAEHVHVEPLGMLGVGHFQVDRGESGFHDGSPGRSGRIRFPRGHPTPSGSGPFLNERDILRRQPRFPRRRLAGESGRRLPGIPPEFPRHVRLIRIARPRTRAGPGRRPGRPRSRPAPSGTGPGRRAASATSPSGSGPASRPGDSRCPARRRPSRSGVARRRGTARPSSTPVSLGLPAARLPPISDPIEDPGQSDAQSRRPTISATRARRGPKTPPASFQPRGEARAVAQESADRPGPEPGGHAADDARRLDPQGPVEQAHEEARRQLLPPAPADRVQVVDAADQLAEAIRGDGEPAHRGQVAGHRPVFHDERPQPWMRVASETTPALARRPKSSSTPPDREAHGEAPRRAPCGRPARSSHGCVFGVHAPASRAMPTGRRAWPPGKAGPGLRKTRRSPFEGGADCGIVPPPRPRPLPRSRMMDNATRRSPHAPMAHPRQADRRPQPGRRDDADPHGRRDLQPQRLPRQQPDAHRPAPRAGGVEGADQARRPPREPPRDGHARGRGRRSRSPPATPARR